MSTPTSEFAGLSIGEMSPPTSDNVRTRAVELRDILSTFEENIFPSDFQPTIFEHIDRPPSERPSRNSWTELGNLHGSLLRWGCYDDNAWNFLRQLVTPQDRATAFIEKLKRQGNDRFDAYERLKVTPSGVEILKKQLSSLVDQWSSWSEAIYQDQITLRLDEAETREADTLQIALEALQRICNYTQPITPPSSATGGPSHRTRARAPSLSDQNLSLFAVLIKALSASKQPFLLSTLEQFTGPALKQNEVLLRSISGLLEPIAPRHYTDRFDALQEKADDERALPKVQAVPGGRKRGHEAEPTSGMSLETAPKRGKRTGGR